MKENILIILLSLYLGLQLADPGLYLSINALAYVEDDQIVKRRLEVNWYGEQVQESDVIVVFDGFGEEIVKLSPYVQPDNFMILNVSLPYPTLDQMGFNGYTCVFGYSAYWYRNDTVLDYCCLKSEPTWMWDLKERLENIPIGQMMLTGAHDAGAYRDYQGVGDDNWATSSVFAQEEDLLHQLIWGVRFVDIRAGYYPTSDEIFWLVHGIIKTHPMQEGIDDVKTFLRNTQEVMVWEINGFEQHWDDEAHEKFKALLISEFSNWLVTPGDLGWKTLLKDIWSREGLAQDQGRIIITYNTASYTDPEFFFPEVNEKWGDKDEPKELLDYLQSEVEKAENNPAYQPWKPNCQMTPNAEDIIGGRWSGLREMADAVNRNVTMLWRDEWTDLPATFSIHDFVKSTNMIQESIERNLRIAENFGNE